MPANVIGKEFVIELEDLPVAEAAPQAGRLQLSVVNGNFRLTNSLAAVIPIGDGPKGIQRQFPGEHMSAPWTAFAEDAEPEDSEVSYVRIWLDAGLVIATIDCFVSEFVGAGGSVNMGIYDQTAPGDSTLGPNARVAQTEATAITSAGRKASTVKVATVATPYTVPATGYYWLALITDNGGGSENEYLSTEKFPSGFAPTRFEVGATTVLPAIATPTIQSGPVLFVSAVE